MAEEPGRSRSTAADLGAWLCFEDESGQGLRPPKGRTWGRRGHTPVVTVTGGPGTRVSLAALIAVRPGAGPRLIFRTHRTPRTPMITPGTDPTAALMRSPPSPFTPNVMRPEPLLIT